MDHFLISVYTWITQHWTEVGVAFFLADKLVKWTPFTEDDEVLALIKSAFKKVFGRDPDFIHRS